jgi:starvation-inducible DNA-binding protein
MPVCYCVQPNVLLKRTILFPIVPAITFFKPMAILVVLIGSFDLKQRQRLTNIMDAEEISLNESAVKPVVDLLNEYLANYHIHYQKLRGCHWNIKGQNFFTLHVKFEELYTNAQLTIDEIAERVLTLGKPPHSRFADYISESTIVEIDTIGMNDLAMVDAILEDMAQLIQLERDLLDASADAGDDGTNDMVNRFMQFKEKTTWMLRSFAGKK